MASSIPAVLNATPTTTTVPKSVNVETKHPNNCHFVKQSINAIKVLNSVILLGTGNFVEIYDRTEKKIVNRTQISNKTVSGIESDGSRVLVYAENVIKLFKLSKCCTTMFEIGFFTYSDWILTVKLLEGDIAFVSMHSNAVLLNSVLEEIKCVSSMEISTCYCAHIAYDSWEELYVLSGTAFSQILVWKPTVLDGDGRSPILYRIKGHKGVVFSIDFSPILHKICSTSDDGRAIVWKFNNTKDQNATASLNCCSDIVKQYEYQHQQRVFRCRFFDKFLVTTAEDSSYRIYDVVADKLLKVANQQIDSIWSVDFCTKARTIFTGSTDGSVVSTPIPDSEPIVVECKLLGKSKNMVLLSDRSAAFVNDEGTLIHVKHLHGFDKPTYDQIQTHDDLKSYCVMEKTSCGRRIALAGFHGHIHIYNHKEDRLTYQISIEISNSPRVFSVHWLTCKTFMTCLDNGVLAVWLLHEDNVYLAHLVELPDGDERWSTSASCCGPAHFVVGDRRGSLYLYDFLGVEALQTFRKIHPAGITKIYCTGNTVVVLGRNSRVTKFYFDKDTSRLGIITSDKLPFSWLAGCHNNANTNMILGFSRDHFVLWDHSSRRIAHQMFCAGGHRSWDFHADDETFAFGYLRNNSLRIESIRRDRVIKTVIDGFHGYETNALKLVKIGGNRYMSVSGGEDTTLRLCTLDFNDDLNGFRCFDTVKAHLSSVRAVACCEIRNVGSFVVFSAGGRAQVIVWRLDVSYGDSGVVIHEKFSYYKKGDDSENRIMDLAVVEYPDYLVLIAGCSDGKVKIFKMEIADPQWGLVPIAEIFYKPRCVLKILTIKTESARILVTATTDGYLSFFDITPLLRRVQFGQHIDDLKFESLGSIRTNQSGINSLGCHNLERNKFVILTGGDDKAFSLNYIEITPKNSEEENITSKNVDRVDDITSKNPDGVKMNVLATLKNENYHFAHITGAFINDKYFVTASLDQKVMVYGWRLRNGVFEVTPLRLEWTCVCDVQGIDYFETREDLKLVLFGNGVQVLSIPF